MTHERKILMLSLSILGACVGLALVFKAAVLPVAPPAHAADEPGGRAAVQVSYVQPRVGTIRRAVRMAAEIKPDRETLVYGMVSGYAKAHPVEVGTRVDPTGAAGERVLLQIAVPELDAAVVTAGSRVARAAAAQGEAAAAVTEAQQGVAEAEARTRQAAGKRKLAEASVREAKAAQDLAETIFSRLQSVVAKSPNLVAQDQVDKAAGAREVARARYASTRIAVEQIDDDVRVAEARAAAAKARVAAAEAAAAAAAAEHSLEAARKDEAVTRQGLATIVAPFRGVVAARFVDTGTLVKDAARNSGAPALFRVVADDKVRVRFYISEPDAPSCRVGSAIELSVDTLEVGKSVRGKAFAGIVTRIADALDPKTRTMEVEADLPNPPTPGAPRLRAAMFARVKVYLEEYTDALLVPARCVRTKKRKSSVMVVQADGTVKDVDVVIGVDDGKTIQIIGGKVDASTRIVSTGRNLVAKGEKVDAQPDTSATDEE